MKKLLSFLLAFSMLLVLTPVPRPAAAAPENIDITVKENIETSTYVWDYSHGKLKLLGDTFGCITIPTGHVITIEIPQGKTVTVDSLEVPSNQTAALCLRINGGGTLNLQQFFSCGLGGYLIISGKTTVNAHESISVCTSGGDNGLISVNDGSTLNVGATYGAAIICQRMEIGGNSHVHVSGPAGIKLHADSLTPSPNTMIGLEANALTFDCTHSPLSVLINPPDLQTVPHMNEQDIKKLLGMGDYHLPDGYQVGCVRNAGNTMAVAGIMSSNPNDRNVYSSESIYIHKFVSGPSESYHQGQTLNDMVFHTYLEYSDPSEVSVSVNGTALNSDSYTLESDPDASAAVNRMLTLKSGYLNTLTPSDTPFELKITYPDENGVSGSITTQFSITPHNFQMQHDDNQHWEVCSVCNAEQNRANHSWKTEWSKDGTKHWHECSVCGAKQEEAAHTWNEGSITKAPSCTEKGEKTYTCKVCGQTRTEEIPAANHSWKTEWSKDGTKHWHECSVCFAKKDEAAHNFGDWTITKEPTQTETGTKVRTCTQCGYAETADVPMLPVYAVLEGAGNIFHKGTEETLTFRADGDYAKFTGIQVDGKNVEPRNYESWESSVSVKLKTEYLETLSAGEHTLTITFVDGSCNAGFTVQNAVSNTPQTGDTFRLGLWMTLGFAALCSALVIVNCRKQTR